MKKIISLSTLILLLTIMNVIAIPNPAPLYCENMGYTSDDTYCIFDEENKCELWDFYNGACGSEYVKELTCKQQGESLSPGYECCEGLISRNPSVYGNVDGKSMCGSTTGSFGICTPCGNGICDTNLENYCNCPDDCPEEDEEAYISSSVAKDIICPAPNCVGRISTGNYDEDNCMIYECPEIQEEQATQNQIICPAPNCVGRISTGNYDEDNCMIYECPELNETEIVTEGVKCVFYGDEEFLKDNTQECYTADPDFSCKATEVHQGQAVCVIEDVKGYKGEKITWKSTCGGYAYTTLDGDNDYAEFKCGSGEVEEEEISSNGFRGAYWECYDGTEERQGTKGTCQSAEFWKKQAEKFCEGHCEQIKCSEGEKCADAKCGVNSFSLLNECYLEETIIRTGGETEPIIFNEETLICKNSCPLDNKCYPFGYRKSGEFCSDDGRFSKQLGSAGTCENNFECSSNVCVNNECISGSLIQKIIEWFKRLFG